MEIAERLHWKVCGLDKKYGDCNIKKGEPYSPGECSDWDNVVAALKEVRKEAAEKVRKFSKEIGGHISISRTELFRKYHDLADEIERME